MFNSKNFRDVDGVCDRYEPISVLEYDGRLSASGQSEGHYTCDIKEPTSKRWFKTNDDRNPVMIEDTDVTKYAYVVLYKRS